VNDRPVSLAHGFEADVGQGLLQTYGATLSSRARRIIPVVVRYRNEKTLGCSTRCRRLLTNGSGFVL